MISNNFNLLIKQVLNNSHKLGYINHYYLNQSQVKRFRDLPANKCISYTQNKSPLRQYLCIPLALRPITF